MTSVLFVCLGNICRSPTAEAVFRARAAIAGLDVEIDSAGTGAWHLGAVPDERAQAAGLARGYDLTPIRARQVVEDDYERFDLVLAMDHDNLSTLKSRAPRDRHERIRLFLAFAPETGLNAVPDPYYGGDDGFEEVLDLIEVASDGLIAHLKG
ncbi:low molecular weight phosphotyrosine protein phosphatase [Parvibaculaceae bacterium PLY_AMNH_Bact1]|nr:low molecular weight phosphotyrosine protein phosphatase [Parvibaculaceae bacterium PLY_AMNH_Bact1]